MVPWFLDLVLNLYLLSCIEDIGTPYQLQLEKSAFFCLLIFVFPFCLVALVLLIFCYAP